MDTKLNRVRTFYTKDVLPARVTRHIRDKSIDIAAVISDQLAVVKNLEEELTTIRNALIESIDFSLSHERLCDLSCLTILFLETVLQDVTKEETNLRSKLLGQQECVEMFKTAVDGKEVQPAYLTVERDRRNDMTKDLSNVVECRETVFSALEILKRCHIEEDGVNNDLAKLKQKYSQCKSSLGSEHDRLKMFNEWQQNPEKMYQQTKKLNCS